MRWGLGPVFIYECLTHSRRWQTYVLRAVGVAALLIAMWTIATSPSAPLTGNFQRDYAKLGESYFFALIGVELTLVMLSAPAATAGSICLDRARGTLAHMLMTDLSDPEIVLGKLAARLLPVFGLVACSWPVMAICSLLGGIDPVALTLAFAEILAIAVLGCTMALALSVWARKSHEVVLATYTVFMLGLLIWPIWTGLAHNGLLGPPPTWTLLANPYYVAYAPYADPGKLDFWDYALFFGAALTASAGLTGLAVWKTRPVACRGSVEKSRGPRIGLIGRITRWLPGPSLDGNPVLWREWHRSRPSPWMLILLAMLMGTTGVLCIIGAIAFWQNGVTNGPGGTWETTGVFSYLLHVIFGLLMLAAVAPTSMAEERQRGSLDVLAATALSTRAIVVGKWLGTFRFAALMAVGPGCLALAMATGRLASANMTAPGFPPEYYQEISLAARIYGVGVIVGTILAHGALIASIGLALAVWIQRQSRAIAFSVALFVLVIAAWPFLVFTGLRGRGRSGEGLAALSPFVTCIGMLNVFGSRRQAYAGETLWWGSFWVVEVFAVAMGLLWLTVRTFDGCFDRISDRPWSVSVRTITVVILAGMIGAGSLLGGVFTLIEGVEVPEHDVPTSIGILAYSFFLAVGLVLLAVESAVSGRRLGTTIPVDEAAGLSARRFIRGRWWASFRLVLLLAIGPAVLAMASSTAHWKPTYQTKTSNDASKNPVVTYELIKEHVPLVGEVNLGQRLIGGGLWIVTILVHGAAAIGVGLALSTVKAWSRRAFLAAIGLPLLVLLILPLYLFMTNNHYDFELITSTWIFVVASNSLLDLLISRRSFSAEDIFRCVLLWDVVVALSTFGLLSWTARAWQRRLLSLPRSQRTSEIDAAEGHPIVETALIGD